MLRPFIDIHTHNPIDKSILGIQNFCIDKVSIEQQWPSSFSAGLHPWFLHKIDINQSFKQLEYISENENFKAVGECGLDRAIARNFEVQVQAFIMQINLAVQINKPIIVHNVRAFADILGLLKSEKPSVPIILHAFNGNKDILHKLLRHNVYFSLGADILKNNSKAQRIIKHIPINRLFLETDEWKGNIGDLYAAASKIIGVDVENLRDNLYYNYRTIFA